MEITKIIEWDMGHRVPNHKSKCRNLHGHRYKLEITVNGDIIKTKGISDEGMVMDFSDMKEKAKAFIDDNLDHGFMYSIEDSEMSNFFFENDFKSVPVRFIPTAENISEYLFKALTDLGLPVKKIKLWETPTAYAEYENS